MPQRLEEELVFKDQELAELRKELDLKIQQLQVFASEMEKVGDTGDISLLFFLAGANFWAILGNFWAILAILGHFWAIMGNFG